MAELTTVMKDRVKKLMTAFAYGGRVDDLGKVDARHNSGMYDYVTWMVALDGATLYGNDKLFREYLVEALERGDDELTAEKYAFEMTEKTGNM